VAALVGALDGLGVSMRVLVIGAHPDDEDTQIIAWLSRGRHVETAYLSLTRGDGGQNIIGNELGEALGAIRTQELLAARRVDGARQYFTRAFDFGFSKSAEETFANWPRDSVLRDVVTVVRAFRPHLIISVFTGTARDGHGHHQAAGILAREAFDLAGDTLRFPPAATSGLLPWTPLKFYRGASFRSDAATLAINVGEYDPLLGRSYAEVAAISRSQHRSQAFGTLERKGVRYDYLQREVTRVAAPPDPRSERSPFDGIDTTWARFRPLLESDAARRALDSLPLALAALREQVNVRRPERSLSGLAQLRRLLSSICGGELPGSCGSSKGDLGRDLEASLGIALARLDRAAALAAGVAIEATAPRELWAVGEEVPIQVAVYNRSHLPLAVKAVEVRLDDSLVAARAPLPAVLAPDSSLLLMLSAAFQRASEPWWLRSPRRGGVFSAPVDGTAESDLQREPALARLRWEWGGAEFSVSLPVTYRYADQIRGEINRPIRGAPPISLSMDRDVEYLPAATTLERVFRVHVSSAGSGSREVAISLQLPEGLSLDSASRVVSLPGPDSRRTVEFRVRGRLSPGRYRVEAVARSGGATYRRGFTTIAYEHIGTQRIYRDAAVELQAVDVVVPARLKIGYIVGVGDNVAPVLSQLGLDVTLLDPVSIATLDLSGFATIVVGARAYEANEALVANNARLLEFVRNGGTLVVQYGQYEMMQPGIMPYRIAIARPHDRVTVENVPVEILEADHPLLQHPNRITSADFDGWVQERALYMPRSFDSEYRPLLAMSDPGEQPNKGGLLVARYGRGLYIYTTLAFFRQLPNGVPGAARLFVNLLAARAQ
jgi:LmbE family N-acetylglucosaminyl deacetylase